MARWNNHLIFVPKEPKKWKMDPLNVYTMTNHKIDHCDMQRIITKGKLNGVKF